MLRLRGNIYPVNYDTSNIMYRLITIISIIACFIPVIVLIIRKLWKESIYTLIATYWLINGLINITTLFGIPVDPVTDDYITLTANYMDVPMVLFIFYVASEGMRKNIIRITLITFIAFEICITAIKGFNYDSVTIILGASLVIIIVFGIVGIVSYLAKIEHTPQENAMVFVYSSFLFFYGSFVIVYVFSYLTHKASDEDTFLLYYLELLIASIPSIYALIKYAGLKTDRLPIRRKVEGF